MNIQVEFNAGTSFQEACYEARAFATKMHLQYTTFDFNGVSCSISQKCDIEVAHQQFLKALQPESAFKFVIN